MNKKPEILHTNTIARSRFFEIETVDLRFSNGVEASWERLVSRGHGAVLVVAIDDEDRLLLIREYGVGVERYELAFPKGKMEAGEDPVESALRELKEETGYGARDIQLMKTVSLAPGYFNHRTHLMLARDLYPEKLQGDEPEPLELVRWPLADAEALMAREDFTEARSLAALFLAQIHHARG